MSSNCVWATVAAAEGMADLFMAAKPSYETLGAHRRRRRAAAKAIAEGKLAVAYERVKELEGDLAEERLLLLRLIDEDRDIALRLRHVQPLLEAGNSGSQVQQRSRVLRNLAVHNFDLPMEEFLDLSMTQLNAVQRSGRGRRHLPDELAGTVGFHGEAAGTQGLAYIYRPTGGAKSAAAGGGTDPGRTYNGHDSKDEMDQAMEHCSQEAAASDSDEATEYLGIFCTSDPSYEAPDQGSDQFESDAIPEHCEEPNLMVKHPEIGDFPGVSGAGDSVDLVVAHPGSIASTFPELEGENLMKKHSEFIGVLEASAELEDDSQETVDRLCNSNPKLVKVQWEKQTKQSIQHLLTILVVIGDLVRLALLLAGKRARTGAEGLLAAAGAVARRAAHWRKEHAEDAGAVTPMAREGVIKSADLRRRRLVRDGKRVVHAWFLEAVTAHWRRHVCAQAKRILKRWEKLARSSRRGRARASRDGYDIVDSW